MFMINNLFVCFFFIGSCYRSILCCQGSECNFQSVIGQQAKHIVVGRGMKLFPTQAFHKHLCAPTEKRLYYLQKQLLHHLETAFLSRPPPNVLNLFLSGDALCVCVYVSQFDKALVLVDISHRISTSQLEEPVHSVICQQVLRLCQMQ